MQQIGSAMQLLQNSIIVSTLWVLAQKTLAAILAFSLASDDTKSDSSSSTNPKRLIPNCK
jgi:hypothetical protein